MAVEVFQIDEDTIEVRGKTVRKDMNGSWLALEELTPSELASVNSFIKQNEL